MAATQQKTKKISAQQCLKTQHTLRLHKYTPNFESMSWKDMVVMDEQALRRRAFKLWHWV
jgi:hypothetical protein